VVLSKDGVAVVLHDVTLNSISNVAEVFPDRAIDGKYFVHDFTLDELRRLSLSERNADGRFPPGSGRFQIATLEEHIQLIQGLNESRNHKAGLYVEVKQPALHRKHGLDPSVEVLRVLKKYGYENAEDRVFLQCFEENGAQLSTALDSIILCDSRRRHDRKDV
jgi:glycerophosphoryl diester phosphodiesterase